MHKRIAMTISESLLNRIDKQRADMPRSRYITRLLENALKIPKEERAEYE